MPFFDLDRRLPEGVQISPRQAVDRAHRMIRLPGMYLMLLLLMAAWLAAKAEFVWFAAVLLPSAFVASWLWWSYATPRWRIWAHARGADPDRLQQLAEREQLVWPRGHFFERTEFPVRTSKPELPRSE